MLYNNNESKGTLVYSNVPKNIANSYIASNNYTAEYNHTYYGTKNYVIDENTEVVWAFNNTTELGFYYWDGSQLICQMGINDWDLGSSQWDLIERDGKIVNGKISGSHDYSTRKYYGRQLWGTHIVEVPNDKITAAFRTLSKRYVANNTYTFDEPYYILKCNDWDPTKYTTAQQLKATSYKDQGTDKYILVNSSYRIDDVENDTEVTYFTSYKEIELKGVFVQYSYDEGDQDYYDIYEITEHKADNRLLNARKTITVTSNDKLRFGSYSNLIKLNDEDFYRYWDYIPSGRFFEKEKNFVRYSTVNVVWDDEIAKELDGNYYAPVAQYRLYDLLYQKDLSTHVLTNRYTTYFDYSDNGMTLTPKSGYAMAIVNKSNSNTLYVILLSTATDGRVYIWLHTINTEEESLQIGSVYLKAGASTLDSISSLSISNLHQWGKIGNEEFGWNSTGETFGNMTGIQVDVYNLNNPIKLYKIYKKDKYYQTFGENQITVSSVHYDSTGKPIGIDKDNTNKRDNFLRSK